MRRQTQQNFESRGTAEGRPPEEGFATEILYKLGLTGRSTGSLLGLMVG